MENNELRISFFYVYRDISKVLGFSYYFIFYFIKVFFFLCKNKIFSILGNKYIIGMINLFYYENLM